MTAGPTTGLQIGDSVTLPLTAVTETFAILAVKRAGKSNAAVVIAEEMYDAGIPWVAIDPKGDWWGVRAAGDGQAPGLAVLVFGGLHGDVPLEPAAGALVADLVVDQRVTCVLDVSEMSKADQRRFLIAFAERLYRRNTEPLHVFCEEADEYIPQRVMGETAKLVGAFETLVKRGGFRGIGITLITQRSASLNKDVLTQAGTLIALRTPSPQDRKAILAWIDHHQAGRDVVDELPSLANGQAWLFSPSWLGDLKRIQFRRRRTFDSGATPEVGKKARPPAQLADVDLAAIKEAMAETIEKARDNDPKILRARVAELERLLAVERAKPAPAPARVKVVPGELIAVVNQARVALLQSADLLTATSAEIGKAEQRAHARNEAAVDRERLPRARTADRGPDPVERPRSAERPDPPARRAPGRSAVQGSSGPEDLERTVGDVQLKAGARRIVDTLARHHPMRMTRAQLGTLAKFKVTGGTFQTYWSTLKRAGLVDEHDGLIGITDSGLDYVGADRAAPLTTDKLLEQWRSALKAGARQMLDVLITWHPGRLSREELANEVGMAVTGGTFQTYLSTLRRNGLANVDSDGVRASDTLFLGGSR